MRRPSGAPRRGAPTRPPPPRTTRCAASPRPATPSCSGLNVPRPTCSVTLSTVTPPSASAASSAGVKCSPAVGAAAEPSVPGIGRLVSLRVVERRRDVRRQRRDAGVAKKVEHGPAAEVLDHPAPVAERLDAAQRPVAVRAPRSRALPPAAGGRAAAPPSARSRPTAPSSAQQEQHLDPAAGGAVEVAARREHARVVAHQHIAGATGTKAARRRCGPRARRWRAARPAAATRRAAPPASARSDRPAVRSRGRRA